MLALLSPAKTQDFSDYTTPVKCELPRLLQDSAKLLKELKKLSTKDLEKLMSISPKLASNVHCYIKSFKQPFNFKNAKPAIMAFRGDVYRSFDFEQYKTADLKYMQQHVRILSGFYGILRPFDLMQAYRLEMGTKLANKKGKNLYEFWGDVLTELINADSKKSNAACILNLASEEYFKAVNIDLLEAPLVKVVFKEKKDSAYKVIGLMAKRARGMLTDYIVRNRVENLTKLKRFTVAGYKYQPKMSSENEIVFVR